MGFWLCGELRSQLLGIHCQTTNILHLQPLSGLDFFNDFFFLKIHELAPTRTLPGTCREVFQDAQVGFTHPSVSTAHHPSSCPDAGATHAAAAGSLKPSLTLLPPVPYYCSADKDLRASREELTACSSPSRCWGLSPSSVAYEQLGLGQGGLSMTPCRLTPSGPV